MAADKQSGKNYYQYLFVTFLVSAIFFAQYIFRHADDNRLTSWLWVFANVDLAFFIPVFILVLITAYILPASSLPQTSPAAVIFIVSFAAGALFWREPEVIVDTSRYFTQAKHLEIYGIEYFIRQWGHGINAWTDLPLVSFCYGLIFKFFGESRIYIQIFTTFLFSLTCVTTFLTGKILWNEEMGFYAGLLLLGIPYLFSQVPLMLTDVPTMFFLTLSVYTFIKAIEKGGVWIINSSAAVFCAVFSKYSTWMMLSVLPVIFLVYLIICRGNPAWLPSNRAGTQACPYWRALMLRGLSVALIAGLLAAVVVIYKFDVISDQIKFLREYQAPGLRRWGESFVSTFLFQIHPLITLAALYSCYEAFKKRDLKFLIVSWLIFLVVLLQIRRSRYVIVIFPMFTLMASYGLQRIRTVELRRFVTYSIICCSVVVAILAYLPFLQTTSTVNLKNAGIYLDSITGKGAEVITIPSTETIVNLAVSVPILDLYTEKNIYYSHDETYSPPFEEIKESPLRFTWEYKNPGYYEYPRLKNGNAAGYYEQDHTLVIISNGNIRPLPDHIARRIDGRRESRVFNTSEGIFGFNPVVTVYLPATEKH
jgi:hypothetical protein